MKFRHNQKMNINSGFYRTYKGRIKSFKETKEGEIIYTLIVSVNDRETDIDVREKDLSPSFL